MINIFLAFITGLTTGGLSCLAVQGGLLASSLAKQIEKDVQSQTVKKKGKKVLRQPNRANLTRPILAFLTAKLLAYTILGFLLGFVGQMFQLSLAARAFLQIAIGIFMLGTALRMLNVHPMFRYFAFEPPAFLRRKLRKTAANADGTSLGTPVLLGLMTVLIPCGVTQAMMAVALSSGSPTEGAALMFAFTLGTSPVFFAVAYFATQLGKKLEKHFMRFVAVVVLLLALVTIDGGVTLTGSPFSFTRLISRAFAPPQEAYAAPAPGELQAYQVNPGESAPNPDALAAQEKASASDGSVITVNVHNTRYVPDVVRAKADVPVQLYLISENVHSCSLAFIIPKLNVQELLEPTDVAVIDIPAQPKGTRMPFMCSMGMFTGEIIFDL